MKFLTNIITKLQLLKSAKLKEISLYSVLEESKDMSPCGSLAHFAKREAVEMYQNYSVARLTCKLSKITQ